MRENYVLPVACSCAQFWKTSSSEFDCAFDKGSACVNESMDSLHV